MLDPRMIRIVHSPLLHFLGLVIIALLLSEGLFHVDNTVADEDHSDIVTRSSLPP